MAQIHRKVENRHVPEPVKHAQNLPGLEADAKQHPQGISRAITLHQMLIKSRVLFPVHPVHLLQAPVYPVRHQLQVHTNGIRQILS